MKPKRNVLIWVAVAVFITAMVACQNPLISRGTGTSPPSNVTTGRISISIARVAPAVAAALASRDAARVASRTLAPPRAYLGADRLELTLRQNSTVVSEWEHEVVEEPVGELVSASIAGPRYLYTTFTQAVAVGTGYTLEARVFNNSTDATAPVVEGTSSSFDVAAVNTDENPRQVDVVCLPSTPISLEVGAPSDETQLPNLWDFTGATGAVVVGSEIWYRVDLTGGPYHEFSVVPSTGSMSYPEAFVFSGDGILQRVAWGFYPGEPASRRVATETGTYYIGVIDELYGNEDADRHFTVEVSAADALVGSWRMSTIGELSITDANVGENIVFGWEENEWSSVGVDNGVAFTRSGSWSPGEESGSYTLSFFSGAPPEVSSAQLTLSDDGPTVTRTMGDETSVFVPQSIVLPPTGLAAEAQGGTAPSVLLTWTASATSGVTGYRVYRRLSGEGNWELIATINDPATLSYSDTTEGAGDAPAWNTPYDYKVLAVAGEEESPISSNIETVTVEGGVLEVYVS